MAPKKDSKQVELVDQPPTAAGAPLGLELFALLPRQRLDANGNPVTDGASISSAELVHQAIARELAHHFEAIVVEGLTLARVDEQRLFRALQGIRYAVYIAAPPEIIAASREVFYDLMRRASLALGVAAVSVMERGVEIATFEHIAAEGPPPQAELKLVDTSGEPLN